MIARVLVTAGANGIGLVMAQAFAARGDGVWVTDVDADSLAALPPGIRGLHCDAASEAGGGTLFAAIASIWSGLDVAIANAKSAGQTTAHRLQAAGRRAGRGRYNPASSPVTRRAWFRVRRLR